ncbi:MAG: signal peptidase I [Chloroflexi bacterium]|nr:signal peptidase I [Chloroflexota bacterium]
MGSFLKTIILALAIFLLVRSTLQSFVVLGSSMEPSLVDGQLILVDKASYRIHLPRRGDIVIFRSPSRTNRFLIKRVIALPGETVEIRNGKPIICPTPTEKRDCWTLEESYVLLRPGENDLPTTVLPDHFYVLGDNRAHSTDSRSPSVGLVSREDIIGRAWLSLWPLQDWGLAPNYSWANHSSTTSGQAY